MADVYQSMEPLPACVMRNGEGIPVQTVTITSPLTMPYP